MQRYSMEYGGLQSEDACMVKNSDGDYVMFADVQERIAELEKTVKNMSGSIGLGAQMHWQGQATKLERVVLDMGDLNRALLGRADKIIAALLPLVAIADAYDANELDDEARKWWGKGLPNQTNTTDPADIELYQGRGGKQLLTLAHCLAAREAIK